MHLSIIVLSKRSQTKKALIVYSIYMKFYKVQAIVTKSTSVLPGNGVRRQLEKAGQRN